MNKSKEKKMKKKKPKEHEEGSSKHFTLQDVGRAKGGRGLYRSVESHNTIRTDWQSSVHKGSIR